MAIIFNKTIPNNKLCLAYNNNVIEFTTDSNTPILNAQITINGTTIVLYPHPNNTFYLNLKQYITTFLNIDNFTDDLVLGDILSDSIYDWTDKIYLETEINIQINFVDLSNETETISSTWLSGYLQLNTREILQIDELLVLAPQINKTNYIKQWVGYPLDFTIYRPVPNFIKLTNDIDVFFYDNAIYRMTRCFISDGLNDLMITTFPNQLNKLYVRLGISSTTNLATIILERNTPKCDNGFYIKWINSLGGYSYWLFENWESNQQTKDLGEINNDYNNLEDTLSKSIQIGKTSQNRVNVTTDVINEQEQLLLSDLFDSPKIYWFIGTPNEVNNFNDWTEISLVTSSITLQKTKRNLNNFTLTFELPTNDTRTI